MSNFLSGVLGGLVVLVLGAVLISTDVIDTGQGSGEVIRQSPLARPAADGDSRGEGGRGDEEGRTVAGIYREEGKGVVFIEARGASSDSPLEGDGGTATGSGFVVDGDGTILTNAHVVEGSNDVSVSFEDDRSDTVEAEVKGRDASTDLAVLKVDPDEVKDLRPIPLGDSSRVQVGD